MPREIWRPFEERFAVRVLEWYGSPEGAFAYNPVGVGPVGSFGRPPAGLLEMDVLDGDGEALPAGRVGELAVRRRDRLDPDRPPGQPGRQRLADVRPRATNPYRTPEPVTPTRDGSEEETYRRSAASSRGR